MTKVIIDIPLSSEETENLLESIFRELKNKNIPYKIENEKSNYDSTINLYFKHYEGKNSFYTFLVYEGINLDKGLIDTVFDYFKDFMKKYDLEYLTKKRSIKEIEEHLFSKYDKFYQYSYIIKSLIKEGNYKKYVEEKLFSFLSEYPFFLIHFKNIKSDFLIKKYLDWHNSIQYSDYYSFNNKHFLSIKTTKEQYLEFLKQNYKNMYFLEIHKEILSNFVNKERKEVQTFFLNTIKSLR